VHSIGADTQGHRIRKPVFDPGAKGPCNVVNVRQGESAGAERNYAPDPGASYQHMNVGYKFPAPRGIENGAGHVGNYIIAMPGAKHVGGAQVADFEHYTVTAGEILGDAGGYSVQADAA